MKLRLDFVTNSSSSSFLLARKGGLNEEQKKAILEYVEENLLGEKVLGPESSEDEIQKVIDREYIYEDEAEEIREALQEGKDVYAGRVSFDETEYHYAGLFKAIWEILQKNGEGNFSTIKGSLNY